MQQLRRLQQKGFTIIELSIVIVVIGILASIVIAGGASYLKKTSDTNKKTSLVTARAALKQSYDKDGKLCSSLTPSMIPDGFHCDDNGYDFCVSGEINGATHYTSKANGEPTQGSCPALAELPSNSSFVTSFSNSSNLKLLDGESGGIAIYETQVEGGESPYTYSVVEGGGNDSSTLEEAQGWDGVGKMLVIMPASDFDAQFSSNWLMVIYVDDTGSQIIFLVVPPGDPTLGLDENSLVLGSLDATFSSMCSSAPVGFVVNLKLIATDNASNQAEAPFTVSCP